MGIVGAGRVTEEYWLPALADHGARTWLTDTNPDRLRSLCRGLLVHRAASVEALLARDLDLVIVATPARTHGAVADAIAAACPPGRRLPVLLEKPPVVSAEELHRLLGHQAEGRIRPAGAFLRRALPAPRLARRRFGDWAGRFGALRRIDVWEGRPYAWRAQGARGGTGGLDSMLFDELSHAVDLALFVAGRDTGAPAELFVTEHSPLAVEGGCEIGVGEDTVALRLHGSRERLLANAITYSFDGGSVTVEQGFGAAIVVRPAGGPPEPVDAGAGPPLGRIFWDLATVAARPGEPPGDASVAPLADWEPALAVLEALHRAATPVAAS